MQFTFKASVRIKALAILVELMLMSLLKSFVELRGSVKLIMTSRQLKVKIAITQIKAELVFIIKSAIVELAA